MSDVIPCMHRLAKAFWRGSYERRIPVSDSAFFDSDYMVSLVEKVVQNAAKNGDCVIVGRGSPYFLRGRRDVFHVFLYAPREEKIRRLMRQGKSEDEAIELVDTVDSERAAFIKRYFGKDWPNRTLYHLMVNTAMGDENVINVILSTMKATDADQSQLMSR